LIFKFFRQTQRFITPRFILYTYKVRRLVNTTKKTTTNPGTFNLLSEVAELNQISLPCVVHSGSYSTCVSRVSKGLAIVVEIRKGAKLQVSTEGSTESLSEFSPHFHE